MAYRSSRPDGINQYNRSNPFFLILRRLTDEQRTLAINATREFLHARLFMIGIALLYLILIPFESVLRGITQALAWILIIGGISWIQYQHFQRILRESDIEKVDQMIYSNDYQGATLNNEDLVNTNNHCSWVNGRLQEFSFQNRLTGIAICIMEVFFLLYEIIL